MPASMHFPFPPPTPTLAAAPNPSKKSQQNNALCLFPARGQRILLYQPEQINKVCGTERFLRILRRGTLGRACLPGGGPGHRAQLCDTGPSLLSPTDQAGSDQLWEPLSLNSQPPCRWERGSQVGYARGDPGSLGEYRATGEVKANLGVPCQVLGQFCPRFVTLSHFASVKVQV